MLQDVKATLKAKEDIMGPIEGRARSMNPYDEQAGAMDAQMRAASQAFGRFMEGGVLRKEDEAKYRKMFPQISDTPEVANAKLGVVERLLTQRQRSDVQALKEAGYDVSSIDKIKSTAEIPKILQGDASGSGLIKEAHANKRPKKKDEDLTEEEVDEQLRALGVELP